MSGILPDKLGFQIIHHHVIVKGSLNHVHQLLAVQIGPYRRALSSSHGVILFALVTSGAGLISIVEGAELTVPALPPVTPDVEPDVVIVRGAVDRAAVNLLPGPAKLVVPVDLVLVDLVQDRDLAAVKAELAADPIQGFGISHVVRCATEDALGQVGVLLLGDVVGILVGFPLLSPILPVS